LWLKVSQIETPLPSWFQAPSTWYAAVAEPHTKFSGNGFNSKILSTINDHIFKIIKFYQIFMGRSQIIPD
jgi:hypothetical protein